MADGIIPGLLAGIDRAKQTAKASLGLLVSNPDEWGKQTAARYFPTKEEVKQYDAIRAAGGNTWDTPYVQKLFNLTQFQNQIAYHGSPHLFSKFNLAKVGSGEGNQQYGYGMYFAEQPEVAKNYITAGQAAKANDRPTEMIYRAIDSSGGDLTKAKDWLNKRLETAPPDFKDMYSKAISGFDSLANKGNLYKVDIPDEKVSTFIDWDTKLAGQKKAAKVVDALNKKYGFGYDKTYTGGDLYNALTADLLSVNRNLSPSQAQKLASEELNNFGIKGIKYFDQNSRGSKQGTRNYVVFDPTDVKILERK